MKLLPSFGAKQGRQASGFKNEKITLEQVGDLVPKRSSFYEKLTQVGQEEFPLNEVLPGILRLTGSSKDKVDFFGRQGGYTAQVQPQGMATIELTQKGKETIASFIKRVQGKLNIQY